MIHFVKDSSIESLSHTMGGYIRSTMIKNANYARLIFSGLDYYETFRIPIDHITLQGKHTYIADVVIPERYREKGFIDVNLIVMNGKNYLHSSCFKLSSKILRLVWK